MVFLCTKRFYILDRVDSRRKDEEHRCRGTALLKTLFKLCSTNIHILGAQTVLNKTSIMVENTEEQNIKTKPSIFQTWPSPAAFKVNFRLICFLKHTHYRRA